MALHDGITFGNHLIFTYGPLGFLSAPTLWYSDTGTIAVFYAVLLRLALASALFLGARRSYGTLAGAITALIVASASSSVLETVPFLIFCVWIVDHAPGSRLRPALMAISGAVAGVELLNKASIGIEITALAIVAAIAAPGRRRGHVITTLLALSLALLVAWTAAGQGWGALPAYANGISQIVGGYAAAMSVEAPTADWQLIAAWAAIAFGLAGAIHMTVDGPARRRWGIVFLWVVFCFFEFKGGFVRHDGGHVVNYFDAVMGGVLAMRWRRGSRLTGLTMLVALLAFAVASEVGSLAAVFNFGGNASTAVSQLETVTSESDSNAITARGREAIESAFPIPQATLNLLQGHTVHVALYQTSVAWAYRLDWQPLPVFQSYSAYTTGLDQTDASAINSAQAPQRILLDLETEIDNRVPAFTEGLTTRTILCRYQQLYAGASGWQVLGLTPNRCGSPVYMETVHAAWNQTIRVPAPPNDHSFVFVRIGGVGVEGLERIYALLYKPAERFVNLGGSRYRLVEETASDGLLMRAAAGVDYPAPFNLAPDKSTISVSKAGQGAGGGHPITFTFFAQSVNRGADAESAEG